MLQEFYSTGGILFKYFSGLLFIYIIQSAGKKVVRVVYCAAYIQLSAESCTISRVKFEKGNKATDWTTAPEDVTADAQAKANAAQAAAEAVAIAKATLAKTEASAYADGIVTAEERRAIADAQAKLAEAKLDAQAKADAAKQAAINDAAGKYPTKTEVSTSIKQLSDSISLKAEKTEVTALNTRVSAAEANLTVQATQIASKVSQNDFNTLGQRVGSAESAITQQATQITAQVTAVNDLTGRVASAELALNPDNIWLGLTAKVDGAIESKVKTGISIAGTEVSIFGTTILNGNLIAGIISATDITTGRLTVKDGAKIGGMVIENNVLKGGSMVLTEGAVVGGFTISKDISGYSLINNDLSAKIEITASNNRYLRIGGKSSTMMAMRLDAALDGHGNEGLSIQSYGANNVCLSLIANVGSAYSIRSFGSHVFGQRNGEQWNAPGVLWCGRYNSWNAYQTPTLIHSWGDGLNRTPIISRYGYGKFEIIHNLNRQDYFIQVIPLNQRADGGQYWASIANYAGIGDNSFSIEFKNDGGSEQCPGQFIVCMFGRNKW